MSQEWKTTFNAAVITLLRGETGAGINECREALELAKGDMEYAERLLKRKGNAVAHVHYKDQFCEICWITPEMTTDTNRRPM